MLTPGVLAQVPGATRGARPDVLPLAGGLTNRSFLVTTAEDRFVVRLGTTHDALLAIDRRAETVAQRLASAVLVAPPVVHADVASGLLITKYVEGRTWAAADFTDVSRVDRLASQLATLQSIAVREEEGLATLDPLALARGYVERIARFAPTEQRSLSRLLAEAEGRARDTGAATRRPVLAHSDLHGSNLVEGGRLWLIDWEYAGVADPLQDVACLLAYYPGMEKHAPRLLAALGLGQAAARESFGATLWLFQMLVYLWYRARRVAVVPDAQAQAAERRAARALRPFVHNGNL
jgi:thiamine kinase-like enzyme